MQNINPNAILRELAAKGGPAIPTTQQQPKKAAQHKTAKPVQEQKKVKEVSPQTQRRIALHAHKPKLAPVPKGAKNAASSGDVESRDRMVDTRISPQALNYIMRDEIGYEIAEMFDRSGIDHDDFDGISITSSPTRFFGPKMARA
ncbi:MAG: hypothetical protein JWM20_610 [Patescibacteria group bacterium]|nr:hypothetical protein [Patescibacteria group bacterium]